MKKMLGKLADLVMWPAYALDDRGHHDAAEAYAIVALVVPLILLAGVALVTLLVTS